jgi:ABC-type Fe3+/spermidine/putrescine transport system ATPase subunit
MSGLRLASITKTFGDFTAVDGLDLDVREGEFITLLGPSGCGKTTTLRIIAGFLVPDTGEVFINEKPVNNLPPNRRNTGMCFQSYALFPHMTVYENVRFGLRMKKVPPPEQKTRIRDVLAMVGLEELAGRKPAELSGGQQQRVALARAVVIQPDVLLFDEPLSNLDAKLREFVRVEIRNLQKRLGITSIYVTHDQAEALVISDRVVVMNRGKIEQVGDPYTVYSHPRTSFVAGFIGLANIFTGEVVGAEDERAGRERYRLRCDLGEVVLRSDRPLAGRDVLFSFRPEDVSLYREPMANRIRGRIHQAIFMGNLTDLFVDAGQVRLRVQMSTDRPFREGDPIELGIPEEAFRILEREAP